MCKKFVLNDDLRKNNATNFYVSVFAIYMHAHHEPLLKIYINLHIRHFQVYIGCYRHVNQAVLLTVRVLEFRQSSLGGSLPSQQAAFKRLEDRFFFARWCAASTTKSFLLTIRHDVQTCSPRFLTGRSKGTWPPLPSGILSRRRGNLSETPWNRRAIHRAANSCIVNPYLTANLIRPMIDVNAGFTSLT